MTEEMNEQKTDNVQSIVLIATYALAILTHMEHANIMSLYKWI